MLLGKSGLLLGGDRPVNGLNLGGVRVHHFSVGDNLRLREHGKGFCALLKGRRVRADGTGKVIEVLLCELCLLARLVQFVPEEPEGGYPTHDSEVERAEQ